MLPVPEVIESGPQCPLPPCHLGPHRSLHRSTSELSKNILWCPDRNLKGGGSESDSTTGDSNSKGLDFESSTCQTKLSKSSTTTPLVVRSILLVLFQQYSTHFWSVIIEYSMFQTQRRNFLDGSAGWPYQTCIVFFSFFLLYSFDIQPHQYTPPLSIRNAHTSPAPRT